MDFQLALVFQKPPDRDAQTLELAQPHSDVVPIRDVWSNRMPRPPTGPMEPLLKVRPHRARTPAVGRILQALPFVETIDSARRF
jgi:hypothetical protein